MKIKDHSLSWPPDLAADIGGIPEGSSLSDRVHRASKMLQENGWITVLCRRPDGRQYEAIISIPENLIGNALSLIENNKGATLGDIGELELS